MKTLMYLFMTVVLTLQVWSPATVLLKLRTSDKGTDQVEHKLNAKWEPLYYIQFMGSVHLKPYELILVTGLPKYTPESVEQQHQTLLGDNYSRYTYSLTHHYRAQGLLCMQSLTTEKLVMSLGFVGGVNFLHQYLVFSVSIQPTRPLFRCKQCAEMDATYPRSLNVPIKAEYV